MTQIGHENFVQRESVLIVLRPDSAPAKKLRHRADKSGMLIDSTGGRKTRSILVLNTNHIVLSSLEPVTVTKRLNAVGKLETAKEAATENFI